jgi:hypothetical protein
MHENVSEHVAAIAYGGGWVNFRIYIAVKWVEMFQ